MSDSPRLLVVGTVALDDVETPLGKRERVLGGSAVYFSVAASSFTRVALVGDVGGDFPPAYRDVLVRREVDLAGLVSKPKGKTFHWAGRYEGTMDQARTLVTDLNVLADFSPTVPAALRHVPFVFLANTDPRIQLAVLDQLGSPRLVVADTMNYWIETARGPLLDVLKRVHGVVLNDAEARSLAGTPNLIAAGRALLRMGPKFVVVKKGEHGSFLFSNERSFALPSYPLETVVDPTGAGDSFAGGILGHLASKGGRRIGDVCEAMLYGTAVASFAVSAFSLDALVDLDRARVEARADELRRFILP